MGGISRIAGLRSFAGDATSAAPIGQGVMGSPGAIGCFAVIGLFGAPFSVVLDKSMLFSLSVACMARIAIVAKWHGALSPGTEVQANTGIDLLAVSNRRSTGRESLV